MAIGMENHSPMFTVPPELLPLVDDLVTEDDKPVDNLFSEKQQPLLVRTLHASWPGPGDGRPFVAMSNVGLFYQVLQPPVVPDAMLSVDVQLPTDLRLKISKSYFVWHYKKVPEVVIEVVSNRKGGEDTSRLNIYSQLGVRNYVIYDPAYFLSREALRVYCLEGDSYQRMNEPIWFPEVNLGLQLWNGRYEDTQSIWLRWVDAKGQLIPTGEERAEAERERAEAEHERAEAERERAQAECERADAERERANAEQERADRLAMQLRNLGVKPDDAS